MSAAAAGLKRLHELHLRLQEVQQQLEHGPRQVKARQQILTKKQAEVDALKAELKLVRVLADQKNLQLKTNESKIADLRVKLNQATSNREGLTSASLALRFTMRARSWNVSPNVDT